MIGSIGFRKKFEKARNNKVYYGRSVSFQAQGAFWVLCMRLRLTILHGREHIIYAYHLNSHQTFSGQLRQVDFPVGILYLTLKI